MSREFVSTVLGILQMSWQQQGRLSRTVSNSLWQQPCCQEARLATTIPSYLYVYTAN